MQEVAGIGQRKGSLTDIKGAYQTPVNNQIQQMYQRFGDVPTSAGRSPITHEIQQQQIYSQQQYIQKNSQLYPSASTNQMRSVEKAPFTPAVNYYDNRQLSEDVNKKQNNILLYENLELQDSSSDQLRQQYPYTCIGILKQEENPDDLFAEALLVGPYHIIVLASQMKKLIVTSDQNITKRLYFQYQGQEINVKDFFLNSLNQYAVALLEKDIGTEQGYLGVINAKINYFVNLIAKQKSSNRSSIINISYPNQAYEINDINCKQLRITGQTNSFENESFQNLPQSNSQIVTKGWYLLKDEQLGYCIVGYAQNNTIPFINTQQVERWMSSSDETVQPDNFSFVASTKMEMKDLTDTSIQKAHSSGIYKICRINHEIIVSSSCDNSIKFWNPLSNSLVKNYKNDQCCRNFCISEDQQYLFGTCDNYIFRMKWKNNYEIDKAFSCQEKIYSICKIKVDEKTGNDIIASGDALGNIYIIDATQMQQIQIIPNQTINKNGHNSSLNSICRINNNQIATAGGGGQLKIWMWEDGFLVRSLEGHNTQKNIYFVEKHPEKDNQLVTASSDQTIRVWDITSGQQVKKILVNNSIYCAGFLNEYELAVGDFNLIRIFNLRTWQYKKIEKHTCRINTICSLNERSFMSGDIEGNIFIFTFEEENQNHDILIEGIQGDSKLIENSQNVPFNKTYKIVYPTYQNIDSSQKVRHTDAELSFERLENQSVRNPESAQKAIYENQVINNRPLQMNQDVMNQKNIIQNNPFGQMQKKSVLQQESAVTMSTPLKQAAVADRTRQNSVHLITSVPYQQNNNQFPTETDGQEFSENKNPILSAQKVINDVQSKSNFPQIKEMLNGQKFNNPTLNNGGFLFSDKKDFSYNYKNPYQENSSINFNNNSLVNVVNPANNRSQSEKKTEKPRSNSSFEMDHAKKDNPLAIYSQESNQQTINDHMINGSGIKNPTNISQSALIAQKLIGGPVPPQSQSQQQLQQQQQHIQQYQLQQRNIPVNPFERKRSNSVVKTSGQNIDEVFLPSSYNFPQQSSGSQPQIYQNNNNSNNISASSIINPTSQLYGQMQTNAPQGRVLVVPRSSSAARLNTPAQQQPTLNNNQSSSSINTANPFNSPNSMQQAMINNIINQKLNPQQSTIINPSSNPLVPSQIKQAQPIQLNYLQQSINPPTLQTNSSAQKDTHSSQILNNPNNNSSENLHKISLIASSNNKESFGQKVRSFTRTPEKTTASQSLAPSPILQIQQQSTLPSNQPLINNQYKPSILRERNQGNSIDLAQQNNLSYKNENDDSNLLIKDSKMRQTYENHITHLKSEIQKLEQGMENKNEIITSLTKEKTEMYEIINQLKREIEIVKQNHDKENKSKLDMIQCSNRLTELNSLNDELIKKISHYQEQEKKNQQVLSDLIESNNQLNENNEQQQKKNTELESLIFSLKQQIQERDQHIVMQQSHIQDIEAQNTIFSQKFEVSQRYNDDEVRNLQKQLAEKERYISNILKGQQGFGSQSMNNDQQKQSKAILKYFSEKESISEINPFETENNRTNTYQDQDSLLFKIDKEEEKASAKFQSNQNTEGQFLNRDLKEKYKKIEIMASLRSAQDEVLNLKSQIQKIRQEFGEQAELTDKYNQLNESFKQKTREVDNWRKIYNEIYEKQ